MKTVDFSKTIAASDLKSRRSRHLIEFTKVCEGQGHFFTTYKISGLSKLLDLTGCQCNKKG